LSRLYLGRFSDVHIGGPSSNQATSLESQMIHPIQLLPGRTLSKCGLVSFCSILARVVSPTKLSMGVLHIGFRQIFEIRKKNCRLGESLEIPAILVDQNPPYTNQRI